MTTVVIESPYSGDIVLNRQYLQECIYDCIKRGESPYASHLMLTEVLNDKIQSERGLGISLGFKFHNIVDKIVFYTDLGMSNGMQQARYNAQLIGATMEFRSIKEQIKDHNLYVKLVNYWEENNVL